MLVRLDVADRLVRAVEERGALPAADAASILLAASRGPAALAGRILDQVVEGDARLARVCDTIVLAASPCVNVPLERARFVVLDVETTGLSTASARLSDVGFLDREFQRTAGVRLATPVVDTLVLARRLLRGRIESASLAALAEFFGVSERPCHRALPDARSTAEILVRLVELAREHGASTVGDLCALARSRAGARSDPAGTVA